MSNSTIGTFPQKGQSSTKIFDVPGGTDSQSLGLVSSIRFTQEFVRWFNQLRNALVNGVMANAEQLVASQRVPNSAMDIYTSAANINTTVTKMTVTNTSVSSVTFILYMPAAPGGAAPENIVQSVAIAAGATAIIDAAEGQVIPPGGTIAVVASVANDLNVRVSGTRASS